MGFCKWPDGCENYCEGSTDLCASHNHLLRKQAREDAKPPKEIKPIPKVTPKMARALKTLSVKKAEHLKKHPDCQIRLIGCTNQNKTVHHSAKRGKNLLNEETFLTACEFCHDQIEFKLSAKERREKGFLRTV